MLCTTQLLINILSNTRKITLIPMNAAKILEADLERMREERVNRLGENGLF